MDYLNKALESNAPVNLLRAVMMKELLKDIKSCDEAIEFLNTTPSFITTPLITNKNGSFPISSNSSSTATISYIETRRSIYKIHYLLLKSKRNNTLTEEFKLSMKTRLQELLHIAMEQAEELSENGVIDEFDYIKKCNDIKKEFESVSLLV